MTNLFDRFAQEESGAVTVDWVVLCAAVIGIGIAVASTMQDAVSHVAQDIGKEIAGKVGDPEAATSLTSADD